MNNSARGILALLVLLLTSLQGLCNSPQLADSVSEIPTDSSSKETDYEPGKPDTTRRGPISDNLIEDMRKGPENELQPELAHKLIGMVFHKDSLLVEVIKKLENPDSADVAYHWVSEHWDEGDIDGDGQLEVLVHIKPPYLLSENSFDWKYQDHYFFLKKENGNWFVRATWQSHGQRMSPVQEPVFEWDKKNKIITVPITTGWGTNAYISEEILFYAWKGGQFRLALVLPSFEGAQEFPADYGLYTQFSSEYFVQSPDTLLISINLSESAESGCFPRQWKLEEGELHDIFDYGIDLPFVWNADCSKFIPLTHGLSGMDAVFYKVIQDRIYTEIESDEMSRNTWESFLTKKRRYLQLHGNRYQRWYYRQMSDNFRALRKGRREGD